MSICPGMRNCRSLLDIECGSYRLGGGEEDVEEIKRHVFFSCINWQDLELKKVIGNWKNPVICLAPLHEKLIGRGAQYV